MLVHALLYYVLGPPYYHVIELPFGKMQIFCTWIRRILKLGRFADLLWLKKIKLCKARYTFLVTSFIKDGWLHLKVLKEHTHKKMIWHSTRYHNPIDYHSPTALRFSHISMVSRWHLGRNKIRKLCIITLESCRCSFLRDLGIIRPEGKE